VEFSSTSVFESPGIVFLLNLNLTGDSGGIIADSCIASHFEQIAL